ncbi:MAG: sugar phosphate isomerase/epimerase [Reichenbachiella sp.]
MTLKRRTFIKKSALAAGLTPLISNPFELFKSSKTDAPLDIHLFSKHLQFLDYQTAGQMAAEMGFSGLDLTVRPKGHVLPENVKTDLPKAILDIEKGGSSCQLITTSIESVDNPYDVDIIKSAAKAGVKYYRTNWFKFKEDLSMPESLAYYQNEIKKLGELNQAVDIIGCYQNHAGTKVGASFWEINNILATVNPAFFGSQYDVRHGMVEGGNSWKNGLKLLKDKIKVIVLKDYKWGKVNGKWKAINVPIGEGMVDFNYYFKLLKKYDLRPPVSLHLEYDLGGAEKGNTTISVDKQVIFDAMKSDLSKIQKLWKEA